MEVRPLHSSDYNDVSRIYQEGIDTGFATFEASVPSWENWNQSHMPNGRFVCIAGDKIVGWAALTAVSNRCVYQGVAEVSVYVCATSRGLGVGVVLMDSLIKFSDENGIWTLQSSVFVQNRASLRLHKKVGFREVGERHQIAKINGLWQNTILLERRSTIIV